MPERQRGRRAFLGAVAAVGAGTAQLGAAQAEGTSRSCSRQEGESESSFDGSDLDLSFLSESDSKKASTNTLSVEQQSATSTTSSLDISIDEMSLSLDVSSIESNTEGPTALIVGGVHGDEVAGYRAAEQMLDWEPDAGRLVVLPKANPSAIENDSRTTEYGDLNRNFSAESGPTTPLSEAIWGVVEQADPDVMLSLHEARGIYDSSSSVGQAVFHSPTEEARDAARTGINRANKTIRRRSLMFDLGHVSPPGNSPSGLLTEKTTYDVGIPSFIVETYEDVPLDARVKWQKKITRGVLDYFDLL
jgi:hypothetical protein